MKHSQAMLLMEVHNKQSERNKNADESVAAIINESGGFLNKEESVTVQAWRKTRKQNAITQKEFYRSNLRRKKPESRS